MIPVGGLAFTLICVFGSFALTGGSVVAILEGLPFELLTILGAAIGSFAMANSMHVMKATMGGLTSVLSGARYHKDDYIDLLGLLYRLIRLIASKGTMAVESHIASYGGLAHFRTWLYAVARNESLMMLRRRVPEPTADPRPAVVGRFTSIVANKMTIADIIRSLPDPYGETLSLQIFEDLDYEAIATRLQIPVGTVRSRLAKGKELLRQALQNAPL